VIGWPCRAEIWGSHPLARTASLSTETKVYPRVLEDLRRSAQRFNVLHRWHREPSDADNDLYLRLGSSSGNCRIQSGSGWRTGSEEL
jgi:hypothetical protein